jgi:hypothetical protein
MATPEATGRAELTISAIARLLASDMREELLAIIREISGRNPSAERLAYSLTKPPNCWASPESSSTTCCAPASSDQSRQGAAG